MTYETTDESVDSGRPLMLFQFADDFGNYWRYNTGTTDVSFQSNTFVPQRCNITEPEITINSFRNSLNVTLERDNALGLLFVPGPLDSKLTITCYRLFDVDSGGPQFSIYWSGRVSSVSFDKNMRPVFACDPRTNSVLRVGQRRICQVICDLALYGTGTGQCNVARDSFKIVGTIHTVTGGTTLESVEFGDEADDWLLGGDIISGNSRRLIISHTSYSGGGTIIINRAFRDPELDSGGDIVYTAYAGCNHTPSTCFNKFSNKKNYGGREVLPVKNPFIGDPII